MKAKAHLSPNRFVLRGIGAAVLAATVVLLGARGAFLLNGNMMSPVALVGSWVMLTMVGAYLVARFRPALGPFRQVAPHVLEFFRRHAGLFRNHCGIHVADVRSEAL